MTPMYREEALDALVTAGDITERVRHGGRWYACWALTYAGMSVVLTLGVGFLATTWALAPFMFGWFVIFVALLAYALRRPVTPAGFGWVHGLAMGGWGLVFAVTMSVGMVYFPAQPAWWVPGALATTVPLAVAAWLVAAKSQKVA